jgi:hypothetical protein
VHEEAERKGIKLRDYFWRYINLKSIFLDVFEHRKHVLNLQSIKHLLKGHSPHSCIRSIVKMSKLLNLKHQERIVNGLENIQNIVNIIRKFNDKGVDINELYAKCFKKGEPKEELDNTDKDKLEGSEFEVL